MRSSRRLDSRRRSTLEGARAPPDDGRVAIENKPKTKSKMGNPAWVKGAPSPNPGGRPKTHSDFRARARQAVDEKVLERWEKEVTENGPDWVKCSELLAAYGYGKPSQAIEVSGNLSTEVPMDFEQLTAAELAELARDGTKPERFYALLSKATPAEFVASVGAAFRQALDAAGSRSKRR